MQREVVFRPGLRRVLFWVRLAASVHFALTMLLCRWSCKRVSAVRTLDQERKISQPCGRARGVVPGRPGYPAEAGGHAGTAARLYRHVSKQFSSRLWFWVTLQPSRVYPSRCSHALVTCRWGAGLRGCSREAGLSPGEVSGSGADSPHRFRHTISAPWTVFFALKS